jgi:hypothetical protein
VKNYSFINISLKQAIKNQKHPNTANLFCTNNRARNGHVNRQGFKVRKESQRKKEKKESPEK